MIERGQAMKQVFKVGMLLLVNSFAVIANDNLIANGQFELDITPLWQPEDASVAVIFDAELQSKVLHISEKKFAYSTAGYVIADFNSGYTYYIESLVKSDLGNIGYVVTYRGDELNNAGEPKDSVIELGEVTSNGEWIEYQKYFTLPLGFDTSFPVKIKPKTGAGNTSDMFIDDVSLVEVGVNSSIKDSQSYHSVSEQYWTANSINGKRLDVMTAPWADSLGSAQGSPNNLIGFDDLQNYFTESAEYGWRFATLDEMVAIRAFYYQEEFSLENQGFLELNGSSWSPKGDVNVWNMAIPGYFFSDHAPDVEGETSWLFLVKEGKAIAKVKHDHSINPSKTSSAALIVRAALELVGGADLEVEATGPLTDLTTLALDLPTAIGGATPGVVTPSIDISSLSLGAYEVEWVVEDLEENKLTQQQLITVVDTTAPQFPELVRKTVNYALETSEEITLDAISTMDLVDGEILASHNLEDNLPLGCYRINWQSEDVSGNISTGIQKLQIIDDIACPLALVSGEKDVVERQEITLDGSLSSVDVSKVISYNWSVKSGERLNLSGSESDITFSAPSVDSDQLYQIKLEVSDGEQSDYTLFEFIVTADPELVSQPPMIVVTVPALVNETIPFVLDASETIVDASLAAQYSWRVVSGPELTFEGNSSVVTAIASDVTENTDVVIELLVDDGINQVIQQWQLVIQDTTPTVILIEDEYLNEENAAGSFNWFSIGLFLLIFLYRFPAKVFTKRFKI